MYNGKLYEDVLMNVDAFQMSLLLKADEVTSPVSVYTDEVSWFKIGKRMFVNLNYMGFTEAPEGFFEVIKDGDVPVLLQVRKTFKSDAGSHNGTDIGYVDPAYDNNIVNYFGINRKYYSIVDGKVQKIKSGAARKAVRGPVQEKSYFKDMLGEWHPVSEPSGQWFKASEIKDVTALPSGYFDENASSSEKDKEAEQTSLRATYQNKIYVIGLSGQTRPASAVVSGTVTSLETGEALPGVVIFDDETSTYARTDSKGRYRISLPTGENTLNYVMDSKENVSLRVVINSDGGLDVVMNDTVTLLEASVISAESMAAHRTTAMGIEKVSIKTINKIPSAFGEGDIIRAIQTLPGVKSVGEGSGGFNVRGGSQDQNLILFNENTIYNPSHLFGIFSAFNPDILESVELYKSSIPAEYGGRISSVLTVKSKDGDMSKVKGSLGIGILTSRLHLEGPLSKGKTSFILAARTSYSDWILGMLPKNSYYAGGSANFTDANLGITHRIDDRNTLQGYAYFANDRFSLSADTTFRYKNINASLVYKHKKDDGGVLQVSTGYDHFSNRVSAHAWENGAYDMYTYIRQAFLKFSSSALFDSHTLNYGAHILGYALDPGRMDPYGEYSLVVPRTLPTETALEPSLFISDNWQISPVFSTEGGIRLSSFLSLSEPKKFYAGPEFRISGKYSPEENISFKAGFNTLRQYIHLISNTSSISPMDTWKLSSADIKPTTGWQGAGGIYWTPKGSTLDLSVEAYWKGMTDCLDYKPGATLSMNENLAEELLPVYGKSYGVELMAKKTAGKLTGWVSYSYSRAMFREMQDRGNKTIAGGNWYNAPYDKPHEFKLAGNIALTQRYSFSLNVDYSTGRPVTVPVGQYYFGGAYRLAYATRNSYRIPDYFRVDLAVNIDPGHYLKALAHASVTVGVYNVTGRKNPYSVFFRSKPSGELKGYMLSVFATQIPYINLNILF